MQIAVQARAAEAQSKAAEAGLLATKAAEAEAAAAALRMQSLTGAKSDIK